MAHSFFALDDEAKMKNITVSYSPEESMSAITTPTCIGIDKDPPGSGTLFDRITGFSNEKEGRRSSNSTEKSDASSPPFDYANSPPRGRLETTVLDVDNVVHSPKRQNADVSFLNNCAITPIKRDTSSTLSPTTAKIRLERSINTRNSIADEWREVKDSVSGKTYYYHRLTRESKWKLPKGAVLRQKKQTKSSKNHSFATAVTADESTASLRNSLEQGTSTSSSPQTSSDLSTIVNHYEDDSNICAAKKNDVKSPQDTTVTTGQLFCLYCGLKCRSLSMLESHLPQCSCFIRMQDPELLSTQMELERTLFNLWSKSNGHTSNASSNKEVVPSPLKETIVSTSPGQFVQSKFKENRGNENSNTLSSPKFNTRERNNFCIEKKTCPFCEEALVGGDQFSSHLLKCKERKRRRNMRRTPKKETVVEVLSPRVRAGIRTPGRRMPWE